MVPFVSIINLDGVLVSYQIIANKDKTYTAKLLKCSKDNGADVPEMITVRKNEDFNGTQYHTVERKIIETIKKVDEGADEIFN